MNRTYFKPTSLLLFVALAATFLVTACQPLGLGSATSTPTPPPDISNVVEVWSELSHATPTPQGNTIVEVWNTLSREFVEKDRMDAAVLADAAIKAMREVVANIGSDPVDGAILTEAAIEGMLEALGDPYTAYLSPHEYSMTMEDIEGQFEGIGAVVGLRNGNITIIAPLPGTPAEMGGILPGDVILEVDGASTVGWSLTEAVFKIRGLEGTTVRLLVQHQDTSEPTYMDIVRGVIKLESVTWRMLPDSIAYLSITSFAENTDEDLVKALGEIEEQGALGIVLDLRNNPGGLLSTTVSVASQFLGEGLVLYSIDGKGERIDYPVEKGGRALDIPLAALVNGYSASGSEVLSGALQDHGRAVLIGTTTFGKGSVNVPKRLSNGFGLYYTVAHWYSPNGRLIEGEGLEPDIVVESGLDGFDDPALDKALEYLGDQVVATTR